jgi:hypothetical protein
MLKILRSQSGNLAIVALLSVVGMMSGISMAGLAMRDTRSFQWDYESIQGIHFLRAEATRGQTVLENNPDAVSVIYTPLRTVGLQNTNLKRTFRLQSRINKEKSEQSGSALVEGSSGATGSVGESREYYKIAPWWKSDMESDRLLITAPVSPSYVNTVSLPSFNPDFQNSCILPIRIFHPLV